MTSKLENFAEERITEPKGNTEDTMYLLEKPNSIRENLQTSHFLEEHSYFLKEANEISKEKNHSAANNKLDMVTSLMRISTGEVIHPFTCIRCHYETHSYQHLKRHVETHISFNCKFCDFRSQDIIALTLHVRKHKPFVCDLYGHMDTIESGLEKLFKTKHSEEVEEIVMEKNSLALDSRVKIVPDTKCSTSKLESGTEKAVESGTENGVENGTENGIESGTEKAVLNDTENGVKSGTENGVESGTENGDENSTEKAVLNGTEKTVENCTGTGVNEHKLNNRGPISSLEESSFIGGKFEIRGNLPATVLGNTISPLEKTSNIGENLYTSGNHPGRGLHLKDHSYFSQEVKESSKEMDSLSVNIKLVSPSSASSISKLCTRMEGAGPKGKNGETISLLEKSSCIATKRQPSKDYQPIENYSRVDLRKYLSTTREFTDRKNWTKLEMVSSLKWISLRENIQYFICKLCQYETISSVLLNRHVKKMHSKKTRISEIINCEYCDYTCQKKISYMMHVRKHTNCMPFICELCGRRSPSSSGLRLHMRKHLKELEEMSKVKDLSLVNSSENRNHLEMHMEKNLNVSKEKDSSELENWIVSPTCQLMTNDTEKIVSVPKTNEGNSISYMETSSFIEGKFQSSENRNHQLKKYLIGPKDSSSVEIVSPTSHSGTVIRVIEAENNYRDTHSSSFIGENLQLSENHSKMHLNTDKQRSFNCGMCEYKGASTRHVSLHLRLHSGEQNFICGLCEFKTGQIRYLKKHLLRKHMDKKLHTCTQCDFKSCSPSFMRKHLRTHAGAKLFSCQSCEFSTARKTYLKTHFRNVHSVPTAVEEISIEQDLSSEKSKLEIVTPATSCTSKFDNEMGVTGVINDNGGTISELEISSSVGENLQLSENGSNETDEKPYTCEFCSFRTAQSASLRIHRRQHTGEISCELCNYKATTRTHLKRHSIIHSGEKPFGCDICDYRFSQRIGLKIHLRKHTGEKPYRCEQCYYESHSPAYMANHIRRHTGEKRISCQFCEYRCNDASLMKNHVRRHTGERPFRCEFCEFTAALKSSLQSHLRTHTGETRLNCKFCQYKCYTASCMKRHTRTHTGEKPYKCHACVFSTAHKTVLANHIRKRHSVSKEVEENLTEEVLQ